MCGSLRAICGPIIDLALAAEDSSWAQDCLAELALHEDTDVRGNAMSGFAQLGARTGELDREQVQAILVDALRDRKAYVREQAAAALLELGWGEGGAEG